MEKIPGILIRVGLVLLVFGFFKDTTVDTPFGVVHNIGLVKESQSLMLFGAIMLIGGLVMKSSAKQRSGEDDDSVKNGEPEKSSAVDSLNEVKDQPVPKLVLPSVNWRAPLDRLNQFRDRFFLRLSAGFVAGVLLLNIFIPYFYLSGLVLFPLAVVLSMRRIPSAVALRKVYFVSTLLALPSLALAFLGIFNGSYDFVGFAVPFFLLMFGHVYFKWLAQK